jgi:hypothetical protein
MLAAHSVLVAFVVAVSLAFIVPAATGGQASKPKYCPANSHVLDGVYHPERLTIMRLSATSSPSSAPGSPTPSTAAPPAWPKDGTNSTQSGARSSTAGLHLRPEEWRLEPRRRVPGPTPTDLENSGPVARGRFREPWLEGPSQFHEQVVPQRLSATTIGRLQAAPWTRATLSVSSIGLLVGFVGDGGVVGFAAFAALDAAQRNQRTRGEDGRDDGGAERAEL